MNSLLAFLIPILLAGSPLLAELQVNPEPSWALKGVRSKLAQPEGVAFSPDNLCMAIANAASDTITLYRRTQTGFETKPCTEINGSSMIS